MNFSFTYKQMESSAALQQYAEQKIGEKISKFVTKAIEAHVIFSVVKHEHKVVCTLKAGDGFSVSVDHVSHDSMYAAVDLLVDKVATQLKKQKEKLKNHKHPSPIAHLRDIETASTPDEAGSDAIDADELLKSEESRRNADNAN